MNGLIEIEKRIEKLLKIITYLKKENSVLKEKNKQLEDEACIYKKESEDILLMINSLIDKKEKI